MSLDEFKGNLANTMGFKLTNVKKIKIDNRDAYYAEGNRIFIQFIHNNLFFTISGWQMNGNSIIDKELMLSSIRTFVIEESLSGEPNPEFRLDRLIDNQIEKLETESNKPYYTNTFYGIVELAP